MKPMNMREYADLYLSCGTLAVLTGEHLYTRVWLIGDSFVLFRLTCGRSFPNWQTAWNEFYTAPRKPLA